MLYQPMTTPSRPVRTIGRPSLGVGIGGVRGSSTLAPLVRKKLDQDPAWSVRTTGERWICPFCLGAIAKRAGRTHEDSIALHLESCRSYAAGRGMPRPLADLQAQAAQEDAIHRATHDPAWQVYDQDGVWISPTSLDRVPTVRQQEGIATTFTYQAMVRHLAQCPFHRQGIVHQAEVVVRVRDAQPRMEEILRWVVQQLNTVDAWRWINAQGLWIDPYGLVPVPGIRPLADTAGTPAAVAKYLLTRCPGFLTDPNRWQGDDVVGRSAGTGARNLSRAPGSTRTPISRTPTGGSPTLTGRITSPVTTPLALAVTPPPDMSQVPVARVVSRPGSALPGPFSHPSEILNAPPEDPIINEPETTPAPEDTNLDWMDDADSSAYETLPDTQQRTDVMSARRLQEKFLDNVPVVEGFRLAAKFEACHDITGDFFAFIRLPDGRVGIALGDVSGHGVQAGLVMGMAKKTLEIFASQGLGPAATLCRVNDALAADLGGKMFISLIYGLLDPEHQSITWARAGHNPTLRFNIVSGDTQEIRPPGMVLGVKAGEMFASSLVEETTDLEPGDVFVLYTDGVTENMNLQQEEFGQDRLFEIMRQHASDGPEALVDQILDRARHFRGPRPAADDITLVALLVE